MTMHLDPQRPTATCEPALLRSYPPVQWKRLFSCAAALLIAAIHASGASPASSQPHQAKAPPGEAQNPPRIGFIGLHGGVFEPIQAYAKGLNLNVEYITDDQISRRACDLSTFRLIFIQHTRAEDRDAYRELFLASKRGKPPARIFALGREGAGAMQLLSDHGKANPVEQDPQIGKYLGNSPENLRRFLLYVSVKYLGQPGDVLPPADAETGGIYHPDHSGLFEKVETFLEWSASKGRDPQKLPRAAVLVHRAHLEFQQPRVVDALIRSFEAKGILAAGFIDSAAVNYDTAIRAFKPEVAVHTCHSSETVELRLALDIPQMNSMFFRRQSIDEWLQSNDGLKGEAVLHTVSQEPLGSIEPQVGAGTVHGQGGDEAFSPIPERIEHLIRRAVSWVRLRRTPHADKRVAVIYYDRELGQNELMRGSATGQFLNGPRSLVRVLQRMKTQGFALKAVPSHEDELISWMLERGRQIGLWDQPALDRLARSGNAVLVPEETYLKWFEKRVPEAVRSELIKHWGPPPGQILTWSDGKKRFIVIPRVDLGNVILLPQPLRGAAHDTSLLHSGIVPPPHNYLATYFWLEEQFRAHALVHFGTHGSEFALPGKRVGLSNRDWTDMIMGSMPNINPWIINNVGEALPVKRRAYGIALGHLTPPTAGAGLSDELQNLHGLIDKWDGLEEGGLKETFRRQITTEVARLNLAKEADVKLPQGGAFSPDQIRQVAEYLHKIEGELTPVNLHVLGEPPRDDLIVPYLVTILKSRILDALGHVVPVPPSEQKLPGDRMLYLRRVAEKVVGRIVREGVEPGKALAAEGGSTDKGLPEQLEKGLTLAADLYKRFGETHLEIDNLLAALDGHFIPPGPINDPMRNPSSVPTGRNLYTQNPDEIPARASWEVAKKLVDQVLERSIKQKGRYPAKIGFNLGAMATLRDYGVMESQILYLLGVEPIWDERNLVHDVRLIPPQALKRPRVDVFVSSGGGNYSLSLPGRLELIDKAIRLVSSLDEPGNAVFSNSAKNRAVLEKKGVPPERAEALSRARIFGLQPGQIGGLPAGYYAMIQRSGLWNSSDEVIDRYLMDVKYVYTQGLWGAHAPETYDAQIQGTETVLRTWGDATTGVLSNKYTWLSGGTLCLAVKRLTGKEPEFLLSDVRDLDQASIIRAEDALAADYRARLFNRKWIDGMMKEGYAGADQIAVAVSNSVGWSVMRPGSVPQYTWEEIDAVYMRDKLGLSIREWFDAKNPFAFQEVTATMLEAARKGYWNASSEAIQRLSEAYARSVVRNGENAGFRTGDNVPLARFVEHALVASGKRDLAGLATDYHALKQGTLKPVLAANPQGPAPGTGSAPSSGATVQPASAPTASPGAAPSLELADRTPQPARTESAPATAGPVSGVRLEPASATPRAQPVAKAASRSFLGWSLAATSAVLIAGGFFWRRRLA